MPVTPFHYPIAKLIHIFSKTHLSLPALIVGSMTPDLEVPFMLLLTGTQDRLILHSLLGGLTFGTLLAVALTVLVYPWLVSNIFLIKKEELKKKCVFSTVVVFSCFIGVLSHVLLDVANHEYNPLFWPFTPLYQTPSPIVPLLGGATYASLIVHVSMVLLFVGLCIVNRNGLRRRLLVG